MHQLYYSPNDRHIGLDLIDELKLKDVTTSYKVLRLIGEYEKEPLTLTTRIKQMRMALAVDNLTAKDEADRQIIWEVFDRMNKRKQGEFKKGETTTHETMQQNRAAVAATTAHSEHQLSMLNVT